MNMKRKENFQMLPKELHQLKYEAISVPQGSVRLVKKTQEKKMFNLLFLDHQRCHEFEPSTTKDPSCMGEVHVKSVESSNVLLWSVVVVKRPAQVSSSSTMVQNYEVRL
ncbi:hypothetical protein TNCV_1003351 [Trichonephila clavipes]|nr:hypothetical protein TNCV_1003351 [Trichonephila clavipes]